MALPSLLPCLSWADSFRLQVRFALLALNVFSQTDKVTDSEGFYNLLIDLLEDEEEQDEVGSLLKWWNQ